MRNVFLPRGGPPGRTRTRMTWILTQDACAACFFGPKGVVFERYGSPKYVAALTDFVDWFVKLKG